MLSGFPDLVAVVVEDFGAGMPETINRLVNVAHGEENIFAANQTYEFRLLLVNILKFVQHDLAELRADTFAHGPVALQKFDRAALEVAEIEAARSGFAFAVEGFKARQDIEDHCPETGGAPIDGRGAEGLQIFPERLESVLLRLG